MKRCIKCKNEKMLKDFYAHPKMKDLHLNKCKSCCKEDAVINYKNHIEHYKDYEIKRNETATRKRQKAEYQKNARMKYPEKIEEIINDCIGKGFTRIVTEYLDNKTGFALMNFRNEFQSILLK